MRTLPIEDGDIRTDSLGNLKIVDKLESVENRIIVRLNWLQGEWFLDLVGGVPYVNSIFIRPATTAIISEILSSRIRSVTDVIDVENVNVELNSVSRKMSYSAIVRTNFGNTRLTLLTEATTSSVGRAFDVSFSGAYD